jgi:hypothetical protein
MAGPVTRLGIANKRKKEAAELAEKMGVLPIEVMLEAMNYHHGRAKRELAKFDEVDELTGATGEENVDHRLVTLHYAHAVACAKDACPYIHPKLIPRLNDVDDPMTLAQRTLAAMHEIEESMGQLAASPNPYAEPRLSDLDADSHQSRQ